MINRWFFKQKKSALILISLMAFAYAVYFGAYVPLNKKAEAMKEEIARTKGRISKDSEAIRRAGALGEEYKAILAHFRQRAPDEQVMSLMISQIEEAAGKAHMRIGDMKPKEAKRDDFCNTFSVALSMDGDFLDIMRFVHVLQNPPYGFSIDEFRFNKNSPRKQGVQCRLVLNKILIPFSSDALLKTGASVYDVSFEGMPLPQNKAFEGYEEIIKKRDIFGSLYGERPLPQTAGASNPALAIPSQLLKNFKLVGIILDKEARAVVEDLEKKETLFLSCGQMLAGAVLDEIRAGKVIFIYYGQKIEMSFAK